MALLVMVVAVLAAAEALLLLLLSIPVARSVRRVLNEFVGFFVQFLILSIPISAMLLLDAFWKFNTTVDCRGELCTSADRDRLKKAEFKSQRNALLGGICIFLWWLLWRFYMYHTSVLRMEAEMKSITVAYSKQRDRADKLEHGNASDQVGKEVKGE